MVVKVIKQAINKFADPSTDFKTYLIFKLLQRMLVVVAVTVTVVVAVTVAVTVAVVVAVTVAVVVAVTVAVVVAVTVTISGHRVRYNKWTQSQVQ